LLWGIGGDFNVIRFPSERLDEARFSLTMMKFFDFIFEQGLMDLPHERGTFMWSNNRDSSSWSRIDRFLVSSNWEVKFPDLFQKKDAWIVLRPLSHSL
jgi:hypothetical protein